MTDEERDQLRELAAAARVVSRVAVIAAALNITVAILAIVVVVMEML